MSFTYARIERTANSRLSWRTIRQLLGAVIGKAAVKMTVQFDAAVPSHFEGVGSNAPNLGEAEGTPEAFARFVRFEDCQPDFCSTSRSGPVLDFQVNRPANISTPLNSIDDHEAEISCAIMGIIAKDCRYCI